MTEPNGQTKRAARRAAREAITRACHSLDIGPNDTVPDTEDWKAAEDALAGLLARAYVRNHNQ